MIANSGASRNVQAGSEIREAASKPRRALRTVLLPAMWMLAGPGAGMALAATFTVTNGNASGAGSLAAAITSANATVTADVIQFSVIGLQETTIGGTLPAITQPLTIDGYTALFSSDNSSTDATTNANIRIELDGSSRAEGATILDIQASNTTIRGLAIKNIPTNGNGIRVGAGKTNVAIHGNYIGTDVDGLSDLSNGVGIRVEGSAIIGTLAAGDRNLLLGNTSAIQLHGSATNADNNVIGLDADGETGVGNDTGVEFVNGASNNNIGVVAENVIAGNIGNGVQAWTGAGSGNRFANNRFYDNGELGIDIGNPGIDYNDEGDTDEGPNAIQNYPELVTVRYINTSVKLRFILRGKPGVYRIYLYRNFGIDPYGFGEGEELLSSSAQVTIKEGNTSAVYGSTFGFYTFSGNENWTAVAEEVATGNTSEFSPFLEAVDGGQEYVVTTTASEGAGSLPVGIGLATEGPEPNTIVFNIPGAGPHTINIPNYLSILGGGTTFIDGFSQPGSKPNTLGEGSNADLRIVLTADDSDALALVQAQNSRVFIQGLVLNSSNFDGIYLVNADGSQIRGNYIGTDATGTVDVGNPGSGVNVDSSEDVTVGGKVPGHRNVISGNQQNGIEDHSIRTRILGNLIGLGSTLQPLGNSGSGIEAGGSDTTIGGDVPGPGNTIASNSGPGVELASTAVRVDIQGNSIFDNGGLGIDFRTPGTGTLGVTPNDTNDTDTGPNGLQNFPVITDVDVFESSFKVVANFDLNPAASTVYRIRFFASSECDASGYGEGERFLAGRTMNLEQESFEDTVLGVLEPGEFVTLTATDSLDNTSEFSACFQIPGGDALCGDASGNEVLTAGDALLVLKTAVGSETCQLCACDVDSSSKVTSSDALLVLKKSVGQSLILNCPTC